MSKKHTYRLFEVFDSLSSKKIKNVFLSLRETDKMSDEDVFAFLCKYCPTTYNETMRISRKCSCHSGEIHYNDDSTPRYVRDGSPLYDYY